MKLWSAARVYFSRAALGVVGVQHFPALHRLALPLPHRHFPALHRLALPLPHRHFPALHRLALPLPHRHFLALHRLALPLPHRHFPALHRLALPLPHRHFPALHRLALPLPHRHFPALHRLALPLPHRHFPALHRHFAAHPSGRRKRKLKAEEKLGKKKAIERTLDLFDKQIKEAADEVEKAEAERKKGIDLKPGTPSWKKEKKDRKLRVEAAKRELAEVKAKRTALKKKYDNKDYS